MSTPTVRPAGHCHDDEAWAEFARHHAGKPRSYPSMTDFELANAIFMCDRDDLQLIAFQTAAKERIRWLILRLAEAIGAVQRLASMSAFDVPRVADPERGAELLARVAFAEDALKSLGVEPLP